MIEAPTAAADPYTPAPAHIDQLPALVLSADLSCCKLDESASILHRWLRQHCEHEAIAITTNGSGTQLSSWRSPTFEVPAGVDWWSSASSRELAGSVVAASSDAASSGVTILVVLSDRDAPPCPILGRTLQALGRVVAARVGSTSATDTAHLSLAHAVVGERDRVTHELTDHFAQHLHTILNHLRDGHVGDPRVRVHAATGVASRALVELRERRPIWRQARRVDEAFAVLVRDLGDLAGAAGIQLEHTLNGREGHTVSNTVLDAACWITRAAMLNVVEHSGAARARIVWSVEDDDVVVSVLDDGSGFETDGVARGGLDAMRNRAEILGGSFAVESTPGWGTRLQARLRLQIESTVQADESASALIGTLGERELEVLRLMAVGYRNREIADQLIVSQHTVKFHVANIFEKLGVRTRAEAAAVAFAAGIHPSTAQPTAAAAA